VLQGGDLDPGDGEIGLTYPPACTRSVPCGTRTFAWDCCEVLILVAQHLPAAGREGRRHLVKGGVMEGQPRFDGTQAHVTT
jgi:hypothetical protein